LLRLNCGQLTPTSRRLPLTAFLNNCNEGAASMKLPSVTGRKAKVPNSPDSDTVLLAFCRTEVSAWLRQPKTVGTPVQPAALANAR